MSYLKTELVKNYDREGELYEIIKFTYNTNKQLISKETCNFSSSGTTNEITHYKDGKEILILGDTYREEIHRAENLENRILYQTIDDTRTSYEKHNDHQNEMFSNCAEIDWQKNESYLNKIKKTHRIISVTQTFTNSTGHVTKSIFTEMTNSSPRNFCREIMYDDSNQIIREETTSNDFFEITKYQYLKDSNLKLHYKSPNLDIPVSIEKSFEIKTKKEFNEESKLSKNLHFLFHNNLYYLDKITQIETDSSKVDHRQFSSNLSPDNLNSVSKFYTIDEIIELKDSNDNLINLFPKNAKIITFAWNDIINEREYYWDDGQQILASELFYHNIYNIEDLHLNPLNQKTEQKLKTVLAYYGKGDFYDNVISFTRELEYSNE